MDAGRSRHCGNRFSGANANHMRIVLVSPSLSAGGAERVISIMANYWAEQDHNVTVLTISSIDGDFYRLSPDVARIGLNVRWNSRNVWAALRNNWTRLRRLRVAIDACHAEVVVSFVDQNNILVLLALLGNRVPVIVSERIDPRHHDPGEVWRWLRRLFYPMAAAVVVQTERVRHGWALNFLPSERVHVIANPLRSLPVPRPADSADKTILAVGRLGPQKGFDLLLQAFARSQLARSGWRLTILGDGPERARLKQMGSELGLNGAVALPGGVPDPESHMKLGAIFVLSSRYEGFPNALLEAMGMGMAVVSYDCESGPSELIRHGINGLLVPRRNVEALSRTLVDLAAEPEWRKQLGTAAMEVRHHYTVDVVLRQWEALIAHVTGERNFGTKDTNQLTNTANPAKTE